MRTWRLAVPLAAAAVLAPTPAQYAQNVAAICDGARLFNGAHEIGTRAGALAVARDIRTTGRRRLQLVVATPRPVRTDHDARRWIDLERRLVAIYARNYVRIWIAIDRANS